MAMLGTVAPTDSRFRKDQLLWEHGRGDQADEEKIRLENKQRVNRKAREAKGIQWVPTFFTEKSHPHLSGVKSYEFIEE